MRSFLIAVVALFCSLTLQAQTNLQFQAHSPVFAEEVSFSAYISDSTFNEDSHLNSTAFWYTENRRVAVNNGIINITFENIADTVFAGREGHIFVYAYVNGQSLGRLPIYSMPYARFASRARNAVHADNSSTSMYAQVAAFADSARISNNSNHSDKSDTAQYSVNSNHAKVADASIVSQLATHANKADTSTFATNTLYSATSDTAQYAYFAGATWVSYTVAIDGVKLPALDGGTNAPVGSYLTKGPSGIKWSTNPEYFTSDVVVTTVAPAFILNTTRWVVSRVAVDYNLVAPTAPQANQLLSVYNGSTANIVTLDATTWGIDTGLTLTLYPGVGRTLWFNGVKWVVIN